MVRVRLTGRKTIFKNEIVEVRGKKELTGSYRKIIRKLYRDKNLIDYFNWKRFNKSIHIDLKKEYINKLEELETLFKIQNIF